MFLLISAIAIIISTFLGFNFVDINVYNQSAGINYNSYYGTVFAVSGCFFILFLITVLIFSFFKK